MHNHNNQVDLETPTISVLAAASKTPFLTAFKVTIGIGLARLILFAGFLASIGVVALIVKKL